MDKRHTIFRKKTLAFAMALTLSPVVSHGAGFALFEQSASGMGTAFSSSSAGAEDASTIYFNPAGLTYVEGTQFIAGAHYIVPSADFNLTSSSVTSGGNGGDGGEAGLVPNLYYARDLNDEWKFGLGINVPFGLSTKYDSDWIGRYHAIESAVSTINFNPSFAFKANDKLSVGFGLNAMY